MPNEIYSARCSVGGAWANELVKAATHNSVDREGESNGANILLCLRVAQTASGMV